MVPQRLPDSDWSNRYHAISFRRLMHVKTISVSDSVDVPWVFESTSSGYPPTESTRTYGGHVFAQSGWAASLTVPKGAYIHNITGWFTLIGDCTIPFLYRVRQVRNGGVYTLRQVEVYQDSALAADGKTPMFVAYVAFKRDESAKTEIGARVRFGHQDKPRNWLLTEYGSVLRQRPIEKWPLCQGKDAIWNDELTVQQWLQRGESFPGLEMRKVDMRGYNGPWVQGGLADCGDAARRWRSLVFYRIIREEDDALSRGQLAHAEQNDIDDMNVHACAHLYASDRNSLFLAQRSLGFLGEAQMGSLTHGMTFSGRVQSIFTTNGDTRKWFLQEAWISSSGDDRVCHQSRIWDSDSGEIIASTTQDGMMRIPSSPKGSYIDGESITRNPSKL